MIIIFYRVAMATEKKQMIHGVEVVFPCKPYPSQFSMMEKVQPDNHRVKSLELGQLFYL